MTTHPTDKARKDFAFWNDGSDDAPHRTWATIADVKAANKAIGHHFFDRKTMQFWASRIQTGIRGGRYFITSEKRGFDDPSRGFTIRIVTDRGDVHTIGDLNDYETKVQAETALRGLLDNTCEPGALGSAPGTSKPSHDT